MSGLQPPRINTQNDQGQDTVSESSDDHFSSASEGTPNPTRLSLEIPITRVERVDDKAAHGEVPGTPAYEQRTADAVPDEVEIVPEGRRSRSATASRSRSASHLSQSSRPETPGGSPIPKTIVERVDDKPAYGEVDGTFAKEQRMADAEPDEVRRAPAEAIDGSRSGDGETAARGKNLDQTPADHQAWFRSMWEGELKEDRAVQHAAQQEEQEQESQPVGAADDAEEDSGDDFDEFAEGDGDDDFGDFDEAEDVATPTAPAATSEHVHEQQQRQPSTNILAGLPLLDLKVDLTASELQDTMSPYLDRIFPDTTDPPSSLPPLDLSNSSPFLSDRSLSLWQQLVSPPPMQPPDWTRSKIRRLFLVSLGVPVDLDEILPPSKQKRLILPNINLTTSPRASNAALENLKHSDANDSSASVDSKGVKRSSRKRETLPRGPPPEPEFDANRAMLICRVTKEAMGGMEDLELKDHVWTLEILNQQASKVLEYWLLRKDEGVREKEVLEGVIENLVGFVKARGGGQGKKK